MRKHFIPSKTNTVITYFGQKRVLLDPIKFDVVLLYRDVTTLYNGNNLCIVHAREAHGSIEYIKNLHNRGVIFDNNFALKDKEFEDWTKDNPCEACNLLNTNLASQSNSPYDKVDQYDVGSYWGGDLGIAPISVDSYDGTKYILLLLCLVSRYCKIYFMTSRKENDFIQAFTKFLTWLDSMNKKCDVHL